MLYELFPVLRCPFHPLDIACFMFVPKVTGKRPRPGETYQLTEADLEIRAARLAKKQKMAEVESNCSTNPSNTLPTGTGSSNGEATRNSNQGNDASSET